MRQSRGFTLVEIVVVLLIFAIVVAMGAVIARAVMAGQKRSVTATRIAAMDAALAQYVALQKRLPCPADGQLPSSDANAGVEMARDANNGCTTQQHGVVPWRVLGLAEQDATDGWGRRLTYRVWPVLGADKGMDMSFCDPAGTAVAVAPNGTCNEACTSANLAACTPPKSFTAAKGFPVHTTSTAPVVLVMDPALDPSTGAAYVIISPGETGGGGYNNNGKLAPSAVADGDEEKKNYANTVVVAGTYFVDDAINDNSGASHFDDIVSHPSILTVVTKAGLGPRAR